MASKQEKVCSNCGSEALDFIAGCIYICHDCERKDTQKRFNPISLVFTKSCELRGCGCKIEEKEVKDFEHALRQAISNIEYKELIPGIDGPTIIRKIPWEVNWVFLSYGYEIIQRGMMVRDNRRVRLICWKLSYTCSECSKKGKEDVNARLQQ